MLIGVWQLVATVLREYKVMHAEVILKCDASEVRVVDTGRDGS